jgi:hypothetical protein
VSGLTQTARLQRLAGTISDRDQGMLEAIGRLRLVTAGQLTRLFFPGSPSPVSGARACRKQLQRLADLGLIESLPRPVGGVRGGSAGTVWRTTSEGRRLTAALGGDGLPGRRSRYLAGAAHQAHTLELSELYVRLDGANRAGQLEVLEHQAEPACWRSFVGGHGGLAQLKPDAFVRLGVGDWEHLAFVELDRGTEGSSALQRKTEAYQAYWRSGHEQQHAGVFPRVVWLATTERRRQQLRRHLELVAGREGPTVVVAAVEDAVTVLSGGAP